MATKSIETPRDFLTDLLLEMGELIGLNFLFRPWIKESVSVKKVEYFPSRQEEAPAGFLASSIPYTVPPCWQVTLETSRGEAVIVMRDRRGKLSFIKLLFIFPVVLVVPQVILKELEILTLHPRERKKAREESAEIMGRLDWKVTPPPSVGEQVWVEYQLPRFLSSMPVKKLNAQMS